MSRPKFRAMVLDLDGVITGTARVHGFAWKSMFDDFLKKRADQEGKPFVPFDEDEDYLQYVDGKPRMKGVKSFLDSRGIDLPFGDMDDPPDRRTVCGLGNRKNADFQIVLRREGPDVFESSVTLIKQLLDRGIKIGVASSSCNCELILELAGIADLFQTRVDGNVSRELKLSGKPDADIFATAAKNLGVLDCETVVVEDAISGVQAGRNGNFGLVLGVARNLPGDELMRHGADLVVSDLGDISVADIEAWFDKGIEEDGWRLTYSGFEPGAEKLRETLLAVGNGYLGTRGCAASEKASEVHYPGTYIAGIYNKIPTKIADRDIYNNDFVNCPNWLLIEFKVGSGRYQSPLKMELLSYDETLDMKRGVLERTLVCKDGVWPADAHRMQAPGEHGRSPPLCAALRDHAAQLLVADHGALHPGRLGYQLGRGALPPARLSALGPGGPRQLTGRHLSSRRDQRVPLSSRDERPHLGGRGRCPAHPHRTNPHRGA